MCKILNAFPPGTAQGDGATVATEEEGSTTQRNNGSNSESDGEGDGEQDETTNSNPLDKQQGTTSTAAGTSNTASGETTTTSEPETTTAGSSGKYYQIIYYLCL